jgi:hypothetical protein
MRAKIQDWYIVGLSHLLGKEKKIQEQIERQNKSQSEQLIPD